jgi:PAB-dependent poly(A)-specific ribonuclease subunit 3
MRVICWSFPNGEKRADEDRRQADALEGMLQSELENGRLFRVMCKFGFINERPE